MDYVPQYILIHHSAANAPTPQFAAINEWHKARDFVPSAAGWFVGYHKVIEKDGTVVTARADTERDCDALGHNFDSLSVCMAGDFDVSDPTPAQIASLGKVLIAWHKKWGINADKMFPHRHFAAKSCYGSRLPTYWGAIVFLRAMVAQLQPQLAQLLLDEHK